MLKLDALYSLFWQKRHAIPRVFILLSILLLTLLTLPQDWTRAIARELNLWAFGTINHDFLLHVTEFGDAVVCGSLGLLVVAFRPDLFKRVLFVIITAAILSNVFKGYFNYPRPPKIYGTQSVIGPILMTRSFPSGHTLTAFIVAGFLWQVFSCYWIRLFTLGLALAVGLSRVLLGVHWLTDVAFGAWLGWGGVIVLGALFPTKFDVFSSPDCLGVFFKKDWMTKMYQWISTPFSSRGNQIVIFMCGILIMLTVIQKPTDLSSVQALRIGIAVVWGIITLRKLYFFGQLIMLKVQNNNEL